MIRGLTQPPWNALEISILELGHKRPEATGQEYVLWRGTREEDDSAAAWNKGMVVTAYISGENTAPFMPGGHTSLLAS